MGNTRTRPLFHIIITLWKIYRFEAIKAVNKYTSIPEVNRKGEKETKQYYSTIWTHILSKLPDDGDPWAQNKLLTPEQKKNTC